MNLNQITIPSLNIEKAIVFYQKLGLKLIVHSEQNYARFECSNGATFSIHQVEQLPNIDGIWVYFEIENLDQYVAELIRKNIEFIELPNDKPWLWREARLNDLDNNIIILYFAGKNRLNPPWKIKNRTV